ncbi:alpha/beta fold hydrolase [Ornithinimicrobium cavernae]|uniref:alpha/beta fold hydrolase n=1 Tax=Ornithinimicrobium cavernae TaxID=2666047 RepID=UPI001379505A|nr:alpha/beta hydrolase [Ornithinimicrobium cavernae]
MSESRIHTVVSTEGTEIAGRVVGQGPPLVLVHGGPGDGEIAYTELLPHLADRFTCYLPSTRGRGLSGDHPDHSLPRLQEDVTAFVASVGEPVGLVGWSGSGPWVLGAAEQTDNVTAVAAWEPAGSLEAFGADGLADLGRFGAAVEQVGIAANDGRLDDALRAFLIGICNDDEIAALERTDFHQRWAAAMPGLLDFMQHVTSTLDPGPFATQALARIAVPVLVLTGAETLLPTMFGNVARFVSTHVADAQVRVVPGVGHFAPVVAPEVLAHQLTSFFEAALQTA